MRVVIYHNEACGTSRKVLESLRETDADVVVVDYLSEGWTRPQLLGLFAAAGITAREALRTNTGPAKEMGLTAEGVSEDRLLDAMIGEPVLVNRPIVCTPRGVRLCRPAESVLELLD